MISVVFARRLGAAVITAVYASFLGACGDGTEPLVPSAIQVTAGDHQSGTPGAAVAVAPAVKVVSSSGKPVPNVRVTFAASAGNGVVVGGAQVTDASGVATVTSWTLGTKAGTSTLVATAEGLQPVSFTATVEPGAPATASVVGGAGQNGLVGTALTNAPAVEVVDLYGNPVPGVTVTFSVQAGSIERTAGLTDALGVASAGRWTLGTRAGAQTVIARAGALAPVTIGALATADVATQLMISRQPSTTAGSGERLSVQPIVEFRDRFDNVATTTSLAVTASLAAGTGTLGGTVTVNAQAGRATFTDLTYTGTGDAQLRFIAPGLQNATSNAFTVSATMQCAGPELVLDYTLGQMTRFVTAAAATPQCLSFSAARNAGHEYLVLFENMSVRGSGGALFPGVTSETDGAFFLDVQTRNGSTATPAAPVMSQRQTSAAPENAVHGWNFGGETIYEIQPKLPAGIVPTAKLMRDGALLNMNAVQADIAVGDTIQVYMEAVRSIPAGTQKAVVRLVTPDIVIAEDLRIVSRDPNFTRTNGTLNTPLTEADMQEIAAEYAKHAVPQAGRFFSNGHNNATTQHPGRPIAVHSLMFSNNVWGYTYSTTNYFVWDYWVLTDGATKSIAQHAQRNADDLFMHEIAHMRHMGLMERAGLSSSQRGFTWVVEGFARFSERLPIAARLLGVPDPSRTSNFTLPFNPAFKTPTGQSYFYDDVPTYLETMTSIYDGYGASAYLFDYFADQVTLAGGDWWTAVPDLLINLGAENTANATVAKYLPGLDMATLITRARVALYTDDYTPGLPAWTQYHMYNLRASRPAASNAFFKDPRNGFPRIKPAQAFTDSRSIAGGASFGYVIDGANATADFRVDFTAAEVSNGVMTVVRIK